MTSEAPMAVVKGGTSYTVDQSFDGLIQCKLCRFRHERSDGKLECRRMPPQSQGWNGTFWPVVGLTDWCGEFRPRVQDSQHDPVASGLKRVMHLAAEPGLMALAGVEPAGTEYKTPKDTRLA